MVGLISKPEVEYIQHVGDDLTFARAAWASTNQDGLLPSCTCNRVIHQEDCAISKFEKKYSGVINFLMKHHHGSPFEHACLTIRVKASLFLFREWHRHRVGFSYNELSARYTILPPEFYVPTKDRPMFKPDKWKPSAPTFLTLDDLLEIDPTGKLKQEKEQSFEEWVEECCAFYERSYELYQKGLEMGLDPGLARMVNPVGMQTVCWVTCNPRSIMHFLSLRTHDKNASFVSYPLYEINEAANMLEELFKEFWPETHKAFCANGRVSP